MLLGGAPPACRDLQPQLQQARVSLVETVPLVWGRCPTTQVGRGALLLPTHNKSENVAAGTRLLTRDRYG